MAIFYILYFCIYYHNDHIVEFMRAIIQKMNRKESKIDGLLEKIDVYGIERLRRKGDQMN